MGVLPNTPQIRTLIAWVFCFLICAACARTPISEDPRSSPQKQGATLSPALKQVSAMGTGEVIFGAYGGRPWSLGVEIAKTAAQRARGLMERKSLGDNEGMLFIFDQYRRHQFYMKNTYIPLDIIFFSGSSGEVEVVGILENMRPFDEEPRTIESPSWSALEVRAPLASQHGIKVGDRVVLNLSRASSREVEQKL